mmetsp:Transcript_24935/g.38438  ORF Transcript_24935/g.38438 Transcript_24935/m.38438 type:complete len:211 (+) Transcript_24935:357-989(+)
MSIITFGIRIVLPIIYKFTNATWAAHQLCRTRVFLKTTSIEFTIKIFLAWFGSFLFCTFAHFVHTNSALAVSIVIARCPRRLVIIFAFTKNAHCTFTKVVERASIARSLTRAEATIIRFWIRRNLPIINEFTNTVGTTHHLCRSGESFESTSIELTIFVISTCFRWSPFACLAPLRNANVTRAIRIIITCCIRVLRFTHTLSIHTNAAFA